MAQRTCLVEGCDRPYHTRRVCFAHYVQARSEGRLASFTVDCSIDQCDLPRHAQGLCRSHYMKEWRLGNDLYRPLAPVEDRFWTYVHIIHPFGCWWWTGATANRGYSSFRYEGRSQPAHRVAWKLLVGPIPDGMELDHRCRNVLCVNPDHMRVVTHKVNSLAGYAPPAMNARKTHCIRGHEFTPENTGKTRNGRRCPTCHRERERERQRHKRLSD
jgi:hypothetical protein